MPDMLEEFAREAIDRLLKELPVEKRLEGLSAEERLKGLSAEDLANSLPLEMLRSLVELLRDNGASTKPE